MDSTDGQSEQDEGRDLGAGVGRDLADDLMAFVEQRVGPVLQMAAEQGGEEGLDEVARAVSMLFAEVAERLDPDTDRER